MTTLSVLLQQIKEREERDEAYTNKIKSAEILIKAEQDVVKKLKVQKRELSHGIEIKYVKCSEQEITKEVLQQQTQIWENLLQEARKDVEEQDEKFNELQQSLCSSWLSLYNDIKDFLDKRDQCNYSNGHCNKYLPQMLDTKVKIEQDESSYENLTEELASLENQVEELKTREIQMDEEKKLRARLEAEPSQGVEFQRIQKELKETKVALKNTENEVMSLKNEIAQKELQILNKKSTEVKPAATQDLGARHRDHQYKIIHHETKGSTSQGKPPASKTVTFQNSVEMRKISPQLNNKFVLSSEDRETPSRTSKKRLAQLSSQLDDKMRNILFKD